MTAKNMSFVIEPCVLKKKNVHSSSGFLKLPTDTADLSKLASDLISFGTTGTIERLIHDAPELFPSSNQEELVETQAQEGSEEEEEDSSVEDGNSGEEVHNLGVKSEDDLEEE